MAESNESPTKAAAAELAAVARERGMDQLEGVKGQLAEGAERVAAAVERTAAALEDEGDTTVSGLGHSLSSVMRQLAGGLREHDVHQFSAELATLARRNPAVFLAGSVALGFGVARFFKAHAPHPGSNAGDAWERRESMPRSDVNNAWESRGESAGERRDYDGDESLDLSGNPAGVARREEGDDQSSEESASGNGATTGRVS